MTSPPIAAAMVFGGRYVVERPLGAGATATVYLCRDRATMKPVAVKVLSPELAESVGAERFLREIRLTAGLDHPAILPVIDSGADGNVLYFVLPYMDGGTLRDKLREKKQLPIADVVTIGVTIANALDHAHARGLIHRDIKPENILFHQGRAYLGDFGIARVLHATAGDLTTTTTGVIRGTPAYMSPEQASGERDYDGRSDIYSLGCVVYEMISGMPPFVGPTSQSVMAQRFSTAPREMRVYRTSVSPELEKVVAKAMMMAPADRFASALEFADQLTVAASAAPKRRPALQLVIGAAVAAVLVVAVVLLARGRFTATASIRADTTQLAVLPFERDSSSTPLGSVDAFIYEAFSAWRGLNVLEPFLVRDAITRKQSTSGVERDRSVAIALGAGRFVRGSIVTVPGGGGWKVLAFLHQVNGRADTMLFKSSVDIRLADMGSIDSLYAALARTLLLRGADSAGGSSVVTTTSLPAMQSFTQGIARVDDWNFAEADSAFAQAIIKDPDYRRAYLWQAQVRFWQRSAPELWAPLVEKAMLDTLRLPMRDRRLAVALAALGRGEYEHACAAYDSLRKKNDHDFAAWFGLGRCRDLDLRIVRDARSPTGWSYRSSYADAVDAYRKAFSVLSLSHISLERGAFEPLRELLFMRPGKLQLAVLPPGEPKQDFYGRLDWDNGRPILRPIPGTLVGSGDPSAVPAGMQTAIQSQKKLFADIAASWSAALPGSAGAKEAVAVSLEMRGDRASLDTLRAARRLAVGTDARLRLASAEVVLRLKLSGLVDSTELASIKRLADSLLAAYPQPTPAEIPYLASLAALTGRCQRMTEMIARAPFSVRRGVARDVMGASDAVVAATTLGCARDPVAEIQRLRKRIESSEAPPGTAIGLLLRAVQMLETSDEKLIEPFAASRSYLLNAQGAARLHRPDSVRRIMTRLDSARARTGYDDITPDAVFLEARVHAAVGDTASAVRALDRLVDRLPFLTPGMLNRPVEMSGLMRAMWYRGELARARGEASSPWQVMRRTLWSSAESGVLQR